MCVLGLFAARIRSACVSVGAHELCRGARRSVGVRDRALWRSSHILHNKFLFVLAQFEKTNSFIPCAGSRRRSSVTYYRDVLGAVRGCTQVRVW